ncbi:MAG: uroporphyrinogen decarboxylase [Thiotrichales bacterium]|nr:uroporphyrinogen decarboxylase [Thiotrichales bacterium]
MPPVNDRLLRALARESVDRTPVWFMRQAGRYLPEYRATRARAGSFLALCSTPELACEVTLQPLRRFPLDAAILFSDILTIPWTMGLGLEFVEGEGPRFRSPVRAPGDIDRLGVPDPEDDLGFVMDAVRTIRRELHDRVPLIGFAGSPWTLATYMIEGGSSRDFARTKSMLFDHPRELHRLLELLADATIGYLTGQVHAGAQALMIFDTWGGVLSTSGYEEFSLRYMRRIVERIPREHESRAVPVVLFTKGGGGWMESIAHSGCDAIGLDWTVDLGSARTRVGARVALQGNLDPATLRASPARIRSEVARTLAEFGAGPGHVFNLGHGITPDVEPDHVGACVDAVHEFSPEYHRAS